MTLDLALSYTPPGSELSVTLATVRDFALLVAVLEVAIQDAEAGAAIARDPVVERGFRVKLAYLRSCLKDLAASRGCRAQ